MSCNALKRSTVESSQYNFCNILRISCTTDSFEWLTASSSNKELCFKIFFFSEFSGLLVSSSTSSSNSSISSCSERFVPVEYSNISERSEYNKLRLIKDRSLH